MKKLHVLFATVAIIFAVILHAQSSSIFIRSFTTKDSVLLRWVPSNAETWKAGVRYGYLIERFTTDQYLDLAGQDPSGKGTLLTSAPILPIAQNDSVWKSLMKHDASNAFVFDALYGKPSSNADPKKKAAEDQMKFGLALKASDLSVVTAKAEGLYFADKTAASGQSYVYRIYVADGSVPAKIAAIISTVGTLSTMHAPDSLKVKFKNRNALLSFNVNSTRTECAGYIIERSEDSILFVRVNEVLYVFASSQWEHNKTEGCYRDSFPVNDKKFYYRVRSLSYFGMEGPPSYVVAGMGKKEWSAFPIIDTLFTSDDRSVQMRWSLSENVSVRSYDVLRSNSFQGTYSVLKKNISSGNEYIDLSPLSSNYYTVRAISTDNDTSLSFPYFFSISDKVPPAVPENLIGKIDTNGVAHLSWNAVSDTDLKGYRVFKCNTKGEEWIEITRTLSVATAFTDTIELNTLTHEIYYCVRSVDIMYNNSECTPLIKMMRPDKIAPVPAVVKGILHTDSTIVLDWINSNSDDVIRFDLLRECIGKKTVIFYQDHPAYEHFVDTTAIAGNDYTYFMIVTDLSGNRSVTEFPVVQFRPRIYPALKNFTAKVDADKRVIELNWQKPTEQVDRFVVYRGKKGEQLRVWKTIDGKSNSIIDHELYPGNTYIYKVKAIYKCGAESKLSEIEVVY